MGNLGKDSLWSQFSGDHFVFSSLMCHVYAYRELPEVFSLLLCMNRPENIAKSPLFIYSGTKSYLLKSTGCNISSIVCPFTTLCLLYNFPLLLPGIPHKHPLFMVASCKGIQKPTKVYGSSYRNVESWWSGTSPPISGGFKMAIDCTTTGFLILSPLLSS